MKTLKKNDPHFSFAEHSANEFSVLVNVIKDYAIFIIDPEGVVMTWNEGAKYMKGYTANEIIGTSISVLYTKEDNKKALFSKNLLKAKELESFEDVGWRVRKDGTVFWADVVFTSLYNERGALTGFAIITKDISAQKLINDGLKKENEKTRNNEHLFKALFQNSTDAVIILSGEGKPEYVTSSVTKILGYSEKEMLQIELSTIAHPDDVEALSKVMEEVLANPGVTIKGHTGRIRHKDGSWRWLEATITNLLHDPAINGIVDNFRDVTERKLSEEKIIHLNRLYGFISQINQAIVHSQNEEVLFKEACRVAIEVGKFKAAWIGIFDAEQEKINLVESCGILPEDLSKFRDVSYQHKGPQRHILDTGSYYVCNNIAGDPLLADWKYFAAIRTYQSGIALPVKRQGTIIGSLNLYSAELNFFTSDEIALLVETTGDISFGLDIFEKQKQKLQADELVKHKELRLRQAQAIAHLGSWEFNFLTGIHTWSEETLRIHGLSPGERKQSYNFWKSFIHPGDLDHVQQKIEEAETNLSNASFKYRIIRKDGTIRDVSTQARFEFDENKKPIGLYGITLDITEQKRAKQQLRTERNLLRTLIDTLPDTIYFKDNAGRKLISNKSDYKLLGAETEAAVLGKTDLELLPGKTGIKCYNLDMEILKTGNPLFNYEEHFINEKNKPVWLLTTKLPLRNEQNEVIGLLGIGRDITERKNAEQELKDLNRKLEKNIKQLKVSNEELEQFAYVASHDLQEPLRMVTSFLSQIEKKYGTLIDDKGKQYIHFAMDGARRMRHIILDLLEFSRVGLTGDKLEEVDLNILLTEIFTLLRKKTAEKKAIIDIGKLPVIKTLRSPVMQVFQNLITNSLTYNNNVKTAISITAKDAGKYWQFAIADNGIGIDPEYFDKIFIIFQRLHNKDEYSGTGIGLAITKKIVEGMGGKIWVESEEGKGSTFYFTILKQFKSLL